MLQEIVIGTSIKLSNEIPDVQIEKLNLAVISGRSTQGVPVLDELKKVLGEAIFLRFDNEVLYADLGYTNITNKLTPAKADVYYKIGYNVPNADDMKEHIAGDVTVKIYTSYRQKNGQYMQEEAGQPGGGVIRKRLQHVSDADARKKIADAEESKRNYTGFEGSLTAFLVPFCKPGMKVKIENPRYPEMNSSLIADSVEVRYGTKGARRIVALSHALKLMSKTAQEIRSLLKGIAGKGGDYDIIEGKVSKVDEGEMTVDVDIQEGVTFFDIKLRSVSDGGKAGIVCLPKNGSEVVFAKIRGEADYILIKTSELDKVIIEIGTTKLTITESGYAMTRSGESLKSILSDLLQAMMQLTVTTNSGPSGVPINMPAFQQVAQRIPNLLN